MVARDNENFRTLGENGTRDPSNTIKSEVLTTEPEGREFDSRLQLFNSTWAGLFKAGLR